MSLENGRFEQTGFEVAGTFDVARVQAFAEDKSVPGETLEDFGINLDPYARNNLSSIEIKSSEPGTPSLDPSSALWHLDAGSGVSVVGATDNPTEYLKGDFPRGMTYQKLVEASDKRPEVLDRYVNTLVKLGHLTVVRAEPGVMTYLNKLQIHRFNRNGATTGKKRGFIEGGLSRL